MFNEGKDASQTELRGDAPALGGPSAQPNV